MSERFVCRLPARRKRKKNRNGKTNELRLYFYLTVCIAAIIRFVVVVLYESAEGNSLAC